MSKREDIVSKRLLELWRGIITEMGFTKWPEKLEISDIPEELKEAARRCGLSGMMEELASTRGIFPEDAKTLLETVDKAAGYLPPARTGRYTILPRREPETADTAAVEESKSELISELSKVNQKFSFKVHTYCPDDIIPRLVFYPSIQDSDIFHPARRWSIAVLPGTGMHPRDAEGIANLLFLTGNIPQSHPKLLVISQDVLEQFSDAFERDIRNGKIVLVYGEANDHRADNGLSIDDLERDLNFYKLSPYVQLPPETLEALSPGIRRLEASRVELDVKLRYPEHFNDLLFLVPSPETAGKPLIDVLSRGLSKLEDDDYPFEDEMGSMETMDLRCLFTLRGTDYIQPQRWNKFAEEYVALTIIWGKAWSDENLGAPQLRGDCGYGLLASLGDVLEIDSYVEAYYSGVGIEDMYSPEL